VPVFIITILIFAFKLIPRFRKIEIAIYFINNIFNSITNKMNQDTITDTSTDTINLVDITVESPTDIIKIKSHNFYHHIDNIPEDDIIEYHISIISNNQKLHTQFQKITDTIYELVLIYNKDNQKIKITKEIKITNTTSKIPKRVDERQNIIKFGLAAKSNNGITIKGDTVFLDHPDDNNVQINNVPTYSVQTNNGPTNNVPINNESTMKFSDRYKLKSYQDAKLKEEEDKKSVNTENTSNKYIPPGKRNNNNSSSMEKSKSYTIFVSGFQEHFTRNNLMEMIPRNIQFIKVSLPLVNDKCKGFGFIDVNTHDDMTNIIDYFDGKLFDHMVLHANEKKDKS